MQSIHYENEIAQRILELREDVPEVADWSTEELRAVVIQSMEEARAQNPYDDPPTPYSTCKICARDQLDPAGFVRCGACLKRVCEECVETGNLQTCPFCRVPYSMYYEWSPETTPSSDSQWSNPSPRLHPEYPPVPQLRLPFHER